MPKKANSSNTLSAVIRATEGGKDFLVTDVRAFNETYQ
jgi:hypothetical protein